MEWCHGLPCLSLDDPTSPEHCKANWKGACLYHERWEGEEEREEEKEEIRGRGDDDDGGGGGGDEIVWMVPGYPLPL